MGRGLDERGGRGKGKGRKEGANELGGGVEGGVERPRGVKQSHNRS